jgi:hypothetical protein
MIDAVTKPTMQTTKGSTEKAWAGMGNDTSFLNSDAAFDTDGNLEALPYWSVMEDLTPRGSE